MLTDDKTIATPEYWDSLYTGKRNNAKVDSSNGVRTSSFDRFGIVADLVEGPEVIEVAAGHARISSIVHARNRTWNVLAADQSNEAKKASGYLPYFIFSVYKIPFEDKHFTSLICTQAFEYFENLGKALTEFKRVAHMGVFTFPKNEMSSWSQLYIFTCDSVKELLAPYGELEVLREYDHLILAKVNFQ